MSRGACHPRRTPDGDLVRIDDKRDGRSRGSKRRDTPYYLRLTPGMFDTLESLLDTPANIAAGSAISGCVSRADLMEAAFGVYLRFHALARNLTTRDITARDIDDLVSRMIAAVREEAGKSTIQSSIDADRLVDAITPSSASNS